MKKIDFNDIKCCMYIAITILALIALVGIVVLKIWVVIEYGDMPITEVPSWAIPWLTGGGC